MKLMTVKEAAEYWGITKRTVFRWIEEGRINPYRCGRIIRIAEEDVIGLLKKDSEIIRAPQAPDLP